MHFGFGVLPFNPVYVIASVYRIVYGGYGGKGRLAPLPPLHERERLWASLIQNIYVSSSCTQKGGSRKSH